MAARVGVILSGCGFKDGSEIQEAVSILIALDRRGAAVICMAPNLWQSEAYNHFTNEKEAHSRNILHESARIARGNIVDLARVKSADLDAMIFPGGYGAAKNLCDFAARGDQCRVLEDVQRLLLEMHKAGKPIGLACIAPVIAAAVFGAAGLSPQLTIGTDAGTAGAINAMGGEHHPAGPADIHIDEKNRLVTTPCYMNDVGPWIVYQGADKMVEAVLKMVAGDQRE